MAGKTLKTAYRKLALKYHPDVNKAVGCERSPLCANPRTPKSPHGRTPHTPHLTLTHLLCSPLMPAVTDVGRRVVPQPRALLSRQLLPKVARIQQVGASQACFGIGRRPVPSAETVYLPIDLWGNATVVDGMHARAFGMHMHTRRMRRRGFSASRRRTPHCPTPPRAASTTACAARVRAQASAAAAAVRGRAASAQASAPVSARTAAEAVPATTRRRRSFTGWRTFSTTSRPSGSQNTRMVSRRACGKSSTCWARSLWTFWRCRWRRR